MSHGHHYHTSTDQGKLLGAFLDGSNKKNTAAPVDIRRPRQGSSPHRPKVASSLPSDTAFGQMFGHKSHLQGWSDQRANDDIYMAKPRSMSPVNMPDFVRGQSAYDHSSDEAPLSGLSRMFAKKERKSSLQDVTEPSETPTTQSSQSTPNNASKQRQKQKQKQNKKQKKEANQKKAASKENTEGKTKAQLKAERRAKQERQRAEKAARLAAGGNNKHDKARRGSHAAPMPVMLQFDDHKRLAKYDKKRIVQRTLVQKQVELFAHLPQYERETSLSLQVGFSSEEIHPSILRLGLRYAEGSIVGSNARCVAMLNAFKELVRDYKTPEDKDLRHDLDSKLKPAIRFLIDCRPQSLSMGNAIRYFKVQISKVAPGTPEESAKDTLIQKLDDYIQERIEFADQVIASHGVSKINDGDTVLAFGCSHVVEMILKQAYTEGKQFTVIVVDSRPKNEGKNLLKRLVKHGIQCTFVTINAVSYVIKDVTKIFMGAYALLANGSVISRVGSAVVAVMAHTYKVPLMVCCETYKFHQRVQLESLSFNELGDPDDLILAREENKLADWRDVPRLKLLNLVYDVTPARYVRMVITEVGMIPPTSVPVILREYHKNTDV